MTNIPNLQNSIQAIEFMGWGAADYLATWFDGSPTGSILFARRCHGKNGFYWNAAKGFQPDEITEAVEYANAFDPGDDLYIKTSAFDVDAIEARREATDTPAVGNRTELAAVMGFALDVDAGKRANYATQADVWLAIHEMPVPPTMVVLSGEAEHGFHVYWKFEKPIRIASPIEVEQLNLIVGAWRDRLRDGVAKVLTSRGATDFEPDKLVDRASAVERVLRPVGAVRKSGAVVKLAAYEPSRRYALGQLTVEGWAPPAPVAPSWPRAEESAIDRYFIHRAAAGDPITVESLLTGNGYREMDNGTDWQRSDSETGGRSVTMGDEISGLPGVNVFSGGCAPLKCNSDTNEVGRRYSVIALWVAFEFGDVDLDQSWVDAAAFCHTVLPPTPAEDVFDEIPGGQSDGRWLREVDLRCENSLASRFVGAYGEDLLYVPSWGKWLVWDGKRYCIDTGSTRVLDLARQLAKGLWDDFKQFFLCNPSRDEGRTVLSFVKTSNRAGGINAFLSLARADQRVITEFESLNSNPTLLNLRNGTYDLATGKFLEHNRSDRITQLADVSYDPAAECPKWTESLELIFDGDRDLIRYVQQILGYSLSGDTGEHILPIAYGGGNNGKSTIWNAILELAGDYGTLANDSLLLGGKDSHPTEKAQLYQKRIVAISEPEQGSRMRESRVKELTGDAFVTARRMREDFWTFKRTHTFWLSTNHLPKVTGTDAGIWRRIKLIPFAVDISDKVRPIPDYHLWLAEHEGSGILNWLLDGYRSYRRGGFTEPQCVTDAGKAYRVDSDHLGQFIAERCAIDPNAISSGQDLFSAYLIWGGRWSKTAFSNALSERFEKKKSKSVQYRDQIVYHGISTCLTG